jgi:tetratricopeptide (TPR) repeat protein
VLWVAGEFSYFMGRYREATDYVEMSLTISRELRDKAREAEALRLLGYVLLARGDRAIARGHSQEALALSRQLADASQLSKALTGLAELHRAEGELDKAQPLHEEALGLSRERGDRAGIASSLVNLAGTSISRGLGDRARGMMREGFAIAEEIGSKRTGIALLESSIGLAAFFSEWESAARLYGATEALSREMGYQREPVDELFLAPLIRRTREALGAAAFAAAESAGRSLSYDEAIAEARSWLEQRS